jgi:hypothetical protein
MPSRSYHAKKRPANLENNLLFDYDLFWMGPLPGNEPAQ